MAGPRCLLGLPREEGPKHSGASQGPMSSEVWARRGRAATAGAAGGGEPRRPHRERRPRRQMETEEPGRLREPSALRIPAGGRSVKENLHRRHSLSCPEGRFLSSGTLRPAEPLLEVHSGLSRDPDSSLVRYRPRSSSQGRLHCPVVRKDQPSPGGPGDNSLPLREGGGTLLSCSSWLQ